MFLACQFKNLFNFSNSYKLKKAKCILEPHNKYYNVNGMVNLEELPDGSTRIFGYVTGLTPGDHGFHIHETGDLSKGCSSLLGHYNPFNKNHGGRTYIDKYNIERINYDRHVGDLGNITANNIGIANFDFIDPLIRLTDPYSVIGRSFIVHKGTDDCGHGGNDESLKTGNAGERIACGIIFII